MRLVCHVLNCGLESQIGGVCAREGEIGTDGWIAENDGAGGGESDFLPDAHVAIAHGGDPIPAECAEECGAVFGEDSAVAAGAVFDGVFVWGFQDAGAG